MSVAPGFSQTQFRQQSTLRTQEYLPQRARRRWGSQCLAIQEQSVAKRPTLTTDSGMPVSDDQNSITAGPRGPVLMQDFVLFEKLAHQNRERIPERGQHA